MRERCRQWRLAGHYRLTEVPPWAHRPVALTVLCAMVAALTVTGSYFGWQRWERSQPEPRIMPEATTGLLVGITAGLASTGAIPAPPPAPAGLVNVHVAGEVLSHGMVSLPVGSRAVDAIKAAGGATELADLDQVNLARIVVDGDQVLVPAFATPEPDPSGVDGASPGLAPLPTSDAFTAAPEATGAAAVPQPSAPSAPAPTPTNADPGQP